MEHIIYLIIYIVGYLLLLVLVGYYFERDDDIIFLFVIMGLVWPILLIAAIMSVPIVFSLKLGECLKKGYNTNDS